MRRTVLVLVMLILSLQSFWAAASATCMHESGMAAQHFGHHAHEHHKTQAASASTVISGIDAGADAVDVVVTASDFDADCATCFGHGAPAAMHIAAWPAAGPEGGRQAMRYRRHVPDGVPDNLLRPPSSFLA